MPKKPKDYGRIPWRDYEVQGKLLTYTGNRGVYAYFIDQKGNKYYINAAGKLVKK
jgi:hypothetical protein